MLYLVVTLAYYVVGEGLYGKTLGKALLGLRVVGPEPGSIGLGRAAGRTLLRIVDGLPFLYLVGFVCLLATGEKRQRIGDMAARTHVVAG